MKAMLLAAVAAVGLGASAAPSDEVVGEIRSSVRSGWRKLSNCADAVIELKDERKRLPDRTFWFWETDKRDQDAKIRKLLKDARELLLSTNAQKIMEEVDELDEDLAELDADIREAQEERALNPDSAKDCEARMARYGRKRAELEGRRRERARAVCDELRALGLNVSGEAADQCLFTVNFGDLIDGVVVSRNIAVVVENLREMMKTGDVVASRRYFGMYLTMVEVQIVCFEDYIAKSRDGEWRAGVNRILADARAAMAQATAGAKDAGFTAEQRQTFLRNAKVNQTTIKAAETYLKVLDAHEAVIARKLEVAQRVRQVVANSFETVNLAGEFLNIAKSNQDAFDSMLELELPPVEMFNDAAVQQEFLAITKKLKE